MPAVSPVAGQPPRPTNPEERRRRAGESGHRREQTHGFVDAIVAKHFEFSIGFDITEAVRLAITDVPADAWQAPVTQDLEERTEAGVAEITGYLDLSAWPEGTRAISGAKSPTSVPTSTSSTPTVGATSASSPTRLTLTSSTWKPATAAMPMSRTT